MAAERQNVPIRAINREQPGPQIRKAPAGHVSQLRDRDGVSEKQYRDSVPSGAKILRDSVQQHQDDLTSQMRAEMDVRMGELFKHFYLKEITKVRKDIIVVEKRELKEPIHAKKPKLRWIPPKKR